jgi:hypothetical protein
MNKVFWFSVLFLKLKNCWINRFRFSVWEVLTDWWINIFGEWFRHSAAFVRNFLRCLHDFLIVLFTSLSGIWHFTRPKWHLDADFTWSWAKQINQSKNQVKYSIPTVCHSEDLFRELAMSDTSAELIVPIRGRVNGKSSVDASGDRRLLIVISLLRTITTWMQQNEFGSDLINISVSLQYCMCFFSDLSGFSQCFLRPFNMRWDHSSDRFYGVRIG